jgi:hypothetical protein
MSSLKPKLGLAAFFVSLAVLMTGPAWLAETPSLVGQAAGLDLTGSVWAHWWTAHALSMGHNPFVGTHSFVPTGLHPVLQYNLLDAIIHAPLIAAFGPRLGYNLATIAALSATGWSAMRLGRAAGVTAMGAVLTGTIVQTSSFVALELHCGRISQVTLVFFLLATARLITVLGGHHSTGAALRLGLLSAATALVYWYFGFAFLMVAAVLAITHRDRWSASLARTLGFAALTGLTLTLPFVTALLSEWSGLPGVERADTMGIVTANSRALLWPILNTTPAHGHQLGVVTLALAGMALRYRVAGWLGWAGIMALGWVLALGPGPSSALPFAWLQAWVPTFDRMWWPYRFELLTVVGAAVMAGLGFDRLITSRARLWLMVALALSILDAPLRSGLLPTTASPTPTHSPSLYTGIDQAIFTVPVLPDAATSERLLWLQTGHERPTQNGDGEHLAGHSPQAQVAWLKKSSLVGALHTLATTGSVNTTVQPEDVQVLLGVGFGTVVVDPAAFDGPRALAAHIQFFEQLWGVPQQATPHGGAWTIRPLAEPVTVSVRTPKSTDRVRRRRRR